jgi:hypothetical protein
MEITKKQWTIIGVVVAIIAVWYFFLRKKKTESNYRRYKRASVGGGAVAEAGTCPRGYYLSGGRCQPFAWTSGGSIAIPT